MKNAISDRMTWSFNTCKMGPVGLKAPASDLFKTIVVLKQKYALFTSKAGKAQCRSIAVNR